MKVALFIAVAIQFILGLLPLLAIHLVCISRGVPFAIYLAQLFLFLLPFLFPASLTLIHRLSQSPKFRGRGQWLWCNTVSTCFYGHRFYKDTERLWYVRKHGLCGSAKDQALWLLQSALLGWVVIGIICRLRYDFGLLEHFVYKLRTAGRKPQALPDDPRKT